MFLEGLLGNEPTRSICEKRCIELSLPILSFLMWNDYFLYKQLKIDVSNLYKIKVHHSVHSATCLYSTQKNAVGVTSWLCFNKLCLQNISKWNARAECKKRFQKSYTFAFFKSSFFFQYQDACCGPTKQKTSNVLIMSNWIGWSTSWVFSVVMEKRRQYLHFFCINMRSWGGGRSNNCCFFFVEIPNAAQRLKPRRSLFSRACVRASSLTYTIIFRQTLIQAPRESISATVAVYLPVLMSAVIAVNLGRMGLTRQTLVKQKEMVFFTLPVGAAPRIWSSRAMRACVR